MVLLFWSMTNLYTLKKNSGTIVPLLFLRTKCPGLSRFPLATVLAFPYFWIKQEAARQRPRAKTSFPFATVLAFPYFWIK